MATTAENRSRSRSRSPSALGDGGTFCRQVSETEGDDQEVAEAFMRAAAASAQAGVKLRHGGPFGACVVKGGIVVSCAHNTVLVHGDPTCHAEMNAVRDACARLQSHDLSDFELYTTCEPCPMCWGAVQWSRLNKVYIGADRFTAAKYGFDDKVFYDEVEAHAEIFGLHRYGFMQDSHALGKDGIGTKEIKEERVHKHMMEVHTGVLKEEAEKLFTGAMNKTYRRRLNSGQGMLRKVYEEAFGGRPKAIEPDHKVPNVPRPPSFPVLMAVGGNLACHEAFMRRAVEVARKSSKEGTSKEREPFAVVVVRDGQVIATGSNSVLQSRDATATAEVNAIRAAAKCLGTYNLQECTLYCTTVPDVMSMSACLWARVPKVFCGATQEFALRFGHEEGWLHFQELMTEDAGQRIIPSKTNVARSACEDVFKFWSSLNGTVY